MSLNRASACASANFSNWASADTSSWAPANASFPRRAPANASFPRWAPANASPRWAPAAADTFGWQRASAKALTIGTLYGARTRAFASIVPRADTHALAH